MRSKRFPLGSCIALLCWLAPVALPSTADAHSSFVYPAPRDPNNGLQTGPCGGIPPTGSPTPFAPGEAITVIVNMAVDHGGGFRIAFSPGNDQGYDNNVLATVPDPVVTGNFNIPVTLPNTPCTTCSLQMIQYDGSNSPQFYSCADIALVAGYDGGSQPPPDAGSGSGGGGGGWGGAPDAGGGPKAGSSPSAGCSTTAPTPIALAYVALFSLGFLRRRPSKA